MVQMEPNETKEIIAVVTNIKKQLEKFYDKLTEIENKLKPNDQKNVTNTTQYHSPIPNIQDRKRSF